MGNKNRKKDYPEKKDYDLSDNLRKLQQFHETSKIRTSEYEAQENKSDKIKTILRSDDLSDINKSTTSAANFNEFSLFQKYSDKLDDSNQAINKSFNDFKDKIYDKLDSYLKNSIFYWIFGILFTILLAIFGYFFFKINNINDGLINTNNKIEIFEKNNKIDSLINERNQNNNKRKK